MRWHRHPDAATFLRAAAPLQDRAPFNQLPLGIARSAVDEPHRFENVRLYTIADPAGACLGAVVQTPPWPVALSEMAPDVAAFAARRFLADHHDTPGVNGPSDAAHTFAGVAVAGPEASGPTVVTRLGVWVLHEVQPVPRPDGEARVARPDDAPLLQRWAAAFREEASPADPPPNDEAGLRYATSGRAWVWEDAGGVVAFANFPREVGGWLAIGPVYTPPEARGRGFATALVAAMSRHALAIGHRGCTLFTDLQNPTSNAIYARIGFVREDRFTRLAWSHR